MHDTGKLQGDKRFEILHYLLEKRVIISMYVEGTDFERLTCLNKIIEDPKVPVLLVDLPQGFKSVISTLENLKVRFTFNGPDRVEYIFTTTGGQYSGSSLKVPFPDFIERIQRRKNFRMHTPPGTQMLISRDKTRAILGVVNISLGGVLAALMKHNIPDLKGSLFSENESIINAGILYPGDEDLDEQIVIIERAAVRRIEHDKNKRLYRYAFEFVDLATPEAKKLTQLIYHFQRMFLKRR